MFDTDEKAEKRICGSCRIGHGAGVAFRANDSVDELGRGMFPTEACIVAPAMGTGTLQDPADIASSQVDTESISRIEVLRGAVAGLNKQAAYSTPSEAAPRLLSDGA
jgi:hypothetical protein